MTDPFEEDDVSDVFPGSTIKKPPEVFEAGPGPWELEVLGPPRTKKTSNEIHLSVNAKYLRQWVDGLVDIPGHNELMRAILAKVKVQPSKLWRQWASKAPIMMPGIDARIFPIEGDLHIQATFYRERAIGDLIGYMQGVADLLEKRQVIANDRQLVCWDGSRLDKDKERPRVELTLRRVEQGVSQQGGVDAQEVLPLDG